jgi:hypothetical protein
VGIIVGEETLFQSGEFPHFESGESPNFVLRLLNCVRKRLAPVKNEPEPAQTEEQKGLQPRFRDGNRGRSAATTNSSSRSSSRSSSLAVSPVLFPPAFPFIPSEGSALIAAEIDHGYRTAV